MEENKQKYLSLLSEIIAKQSIILGPGMAIMKARGVQGLVVDDSGKVTDVDGNPAEMVQKLVDQYVELSGQIVKSALSSIFVKYPELKKVD